MPGKPFAEVVLPMPVDRPFTYAVPAALRHRVAVGMRAIVPVHNRIETGYIVALSEETDVEHVRSVIDLPDAGPLLSEGLLELCRWMADYYCCSWGEALQCAVPPGIHIRSKVRYVLQHDRLGPGRFTDRQRRAVAELHRRGPLTEGQLARVLGRGALSNTLHSLVARGIVRTEALVPRSSVSFHTETYVRLVEDSIPQEGELAALQRRAPKQAAVYLDLLYGNGERAAATLYEKHGVTAAVLRALEQKGLIALEERDVFRTPRLDADANAADRLELNEEQQVAYDAISGAIDQGDYQTFLLKGITASGKTEVYLQAIEHALERGRDAIILVPEISLTPQTVGRFKARFQAQIAVLHSGLGAGERYDEWRRAQQGDVRIVVGARSAVFAPLPNLGIVVVDEEHDTSYKQTEVPRYHGRDVAVMRAKMTRAVCVLGSATPSLESSFNSDKGRFVRLELRHRATQATLPEVSIVDMRAETKELGAKAILSRPLENEMHERLAEGDQVLLLLNRRGFAPFVLCPQCGWVAYCADCNVTLTYHAKGARLRCHYCNARRAVPQLCDECRFRPLLYVGTGTQKLEDLLMRSFPEARIERMDADTTAAKGGHAKILGRFAAGGIDVLVGTQMIAKGHDYPRVTLVGVVNAETGLALPDFRAAEIAFQLLTQVAGRAGRGDRPGKVVIQTYRPNHYAIVAAMQHDYDRFYEQEMVHRERAGYPPFRRMANLAIECEDALLAERATGVLHRTVREQIGALNFRGVEILGPAPATVRRVRKKYRWNLGLLSKSAKRLNVLARATRDAFLKENPSAKAQLKIDLDPYGIF